MRILRRQKNVKHHTKKSTNNLREYKSRNICWRNTCKWNCAAVSQLQPTDAKYQRAKLLIKNYSPPNSESAQIASAWTAGEWTLIEVEFTDLLPAVVLIQTKENHSFIVQDAVWSGYTKPWKSAPFIRQYISKNRSDMPTALTDCFEPQSLSFLQ